MARKHLSDALYYNELLKCLPFIKLFQDFSLEEKEDSESEEDPTYFIDRSNCVDEEYGSGLCDENDDVWHEMSYNYFNGTSWDLENNVE